MSYESPVALANTPSTAWSPTLTGFTAVGSPTVTGRYFTSGRMCFAQIKIVPGTTIASIAGTSYTDLPVAPAASGMAGLITAANLTTLIGLGTGVLDYANAKSYPPAWGASTNTFELAIAYEV